MNKYWIFILLSLASYVDAQQEDSSSPSSSYNRVVNPEKKSTPSQDAHQEEEKKDNQKADTTESGQKEDKKKEQAKKSPHSFTGAVSFVSDYRFRGISQTMRRPAVQGNLDYVHEGGGYLGTFGSNVDGTTHFYNNTSLEWDFYGGYKGKILPCSLPDFTYNIGLIYYYYPGGEAKVPARVLYNTGEFYIELTYKWLSIKYSQALTNYFGVNQDNPPTNQKKHYTDRPNGSSRGSNYLEANLNVDLLQNVCFFFLKGGKLHLLLHVGHLTVRNYEHLSYTDWRATLTQDFEWFNVFISYVGTNANHDYYDVPDNAFHRKTRHLGAQGVVIGVIRVF